MIPMLDLAEQYRTLRPKIDRVIQEVAAGGQSVMGPNVTAFEQELGAFLGARHALAAPRGPTRCSWRCGGWASGRGTRC